MVGVLDGLVEAERSGCDVAIIAWGGDPALQPARDLVSMPSSA